MAFIRDKNNSRLLLLVFLLSLPVLAQEIIFTDGFENHPPLITSSPILSGKVGEAYRYDVHAMDIDGNTVRYLLKTAPGGMHINVISGEIFWMPDKEGSFPATVEVFDPEGAAGMQSWSINVAAGQDSDVDGLADYVEGLLGTDPNDPDSDADGLTDGDEVNTYDTDPLDPDSDNDSLTDGNEVNTYSTDPTKIDTDGDFFGDGLELEAGTDPLNPNDFPAGPPDPHAIATANDPTIVTTLFGATAFIYGHTPPIQTGLVEGTIDPLRVAVLRGMVFTSDGTPLPGVNITVHQHPEFGQTKSRVNGQFDLVVNGGSPLIVNYEKNGSLPAQRLVDVPWQEYSIVPDVALIPLDSQVTEIDLSIGDMQVAQGSLITDDDGDRQATLLFSQGNTAELVMPDGSVQPISSLHVRATEFTVGENGPAAMPGELPYNSGYNYAVELSVDEAIAAGAADVRFSEPVQLYVDNFVGIPVGTDVPTGYYDRGLAAWVPIDDGRVVKILSVNGGLAELDTGGTGNPADAAALEALGISDAERQRLASLYQPGDELWRVPITHFTPYDCNYPYGPPPDARTPEVAGPKSGAAKTLPAICTASGASIIECQSQVYSEDLSIIGTPFSLVYRSDRVPGRSDFNSVQIPLSGNTIPDSLKRIELQFSVEGRLSQSVFPPDVNLNTVYNWDGKDAYGREVQGIKRLTGSIGYVYEQVRLSPGDFVRSFARFGDSELAIGAGRVEVSLKQPFITTVGTWDARSQGLGGWTLDVHHAYDPVSRTLFTGYNSASSASNINSTLKNIVDIQPLLNRPSNQSLAVGPDGTVFININASERGGGIWRIEADRSATLLGRSHGTSCNTSPDGTPFSNVRICNAYSLEMGPDGLLYFADGARIRRINPYDPNSLLETVAGSGIQGFAGDGGPATEASLGFFISFAVSKDGSLYIADSDNHRIRQVTPDGVIGTIAGTGDNSIAGDGFAARLAELANPVGIAVDDLGNIYFSDGKRGSGSGTGACQIRRIGPDGIIEHFAGTGQCGDGVDGISADESMLGHMPHEITVVEDGLIITDVNFDVRNSAYLGRVRKINSEGIIKTIIGGGQSLPEDGTPPLSAAFGYIGGFVQGQDGTNYLFDNLPRSVSPVLPGLTLADVGIAAEGGDLFYVFNSVGRHLRTLNALTGVPLLEFAYTVDGLVGNITDSFGNVTKIVRDAQGTPSALVAPLGQRTELQVNPSGFLSRITNPAGESANFQYTSEGLLTQLIRPDGHTSSYEYNDLGLLTKADDGSGYTITLERTEFQNGYEIKRTSGMGVVSTYRVEESPVGDTLLTNTDAAGAVTMITEGGDGTRSVISPNGATETQTIKPDPRFGSRAFGGETFTITSPGGKILLVESEREVNMANIDDLFSITSFKNSRTVGDRTITEVYDTATQILTLTTPEGRVSTTTSDEFGRTIEVDPGGGLDVRTWNYDADGQVDTIVQGTHSLEHHYDLKGRMTKQTDVLGREQLFAYDDADRITTLITPGSRTYGFTYDSIGLMRTITLPNGHVHELDYAPFGGLIGYTPPDAGVMEQTYDNDRHRVSVVLADGRTQSNTQDSNYRSDAIIYPEATVSFSYHGLTHQFDEIVWTPTSGAAHKQAFTFDGDLLTGLTLDLGGVSDEFSYIRDDVWRLSETRLNNEQMITWTYNDDDQPVSYGPFGITRDGPAGAPSKYSDGTITIDYALDSMGRLTGRTHTIGTSVIYDLQLDHATGSDLISQRIETISGSTTTLDYDYSLDNEVISVTEGLTEIENYAYDINGNRNLANGAVANFDNQDRLISYNGVDYSFDANGFLSTRGADSFTYSTRGELLSATVDGDTVTYSYDAVGRQVARTQGSDTTQYLFGDPNDPFRLSASRAPDGTLSQYYYDQAGLLIGLERAGERFYVITDQVGSPRLIVNNLAVIQREIGYNVFGEIVSDTGGFDLVIGFGGGLLDELTSLNRMGFRDYDAETGRWTSRDPILFRGGQFNLYLYANNNPVNLRDPSGLICIGASAYVGPGGGGKVCYKDGKWSACLEVGLGAGGGLGLDLFGKTAPRADADYVNATATVGCGPAQLGVGLKLNDCGDLLLSGTQQFAVGGVGGGNKREKNFTTGQRTDTNFGMGPPGTGATAQLELIGIDCPGGCPNPLGTSFDPNKNDPKKAGTLSCKAQITAVAGVCTGSDFF